MSFSTSFYFGPRKWKSETFKGTPRTEFKVHPKFQNRPKKFAPSLAKSCESSSTQDHVLRLLKPITNKRNVLQIRIECEFQHPQNLRRPTSSEIPLWTMGSLRRYTTGVKYTSTRSPKPSFRVCL